MMAIKFEWDEKYSVGNEQIGQQYQYLFTLGNELQMVTIAEKKAVVLKLYKYTLDHFQTEEEYMAALHFPLYKEHIQIHSDLISLLNNITADGIDKPEQATQFETFFYRWLTRHIMVEDRKFAEFSKTL